MSARPLSFVEELRKLEERMALADRRHLLTGKLVAREAHVEKIRYTVLFKNDGSWWEYKATSDREQAVKWLPDARASGNGNQAAIRAQVSARWIEHEDKPA